jgi:hypothetical protein
MILPLILVGVFFIHGITHNKPCSNEEFNKKISEVSEENRRSK